MASNTLYSLTEENLTSLWELMSTITPSEITVADDEPTPLDESPGSEHDDKYKNIDWRYLPTFQSASVAVLKDSSFIWKYGWRIQ